MDHALRPWRIGSLHRGVADVLELPAGTLAASGTAVGDNWRWWRRRGLWGGGENEGCS
jgi:uncharacterized membrane protein (UPF0127 family)